MGSTIKVTAGKVTERQGEDGTGRYFDVEVTVDGVEGKVSVEADGAPLAGSCGLSDWVSKPLVGILGGHDDLIGEVRAVAAAAIGARS